MEWPLIQSVFGNIFIKQSRIIKRDGLITSDDLEIAEILNNFLVTSSLVKTYLIYHKRKLSVKENPYHLYKSLLNVSGSSYVDLICLILLVLFIVILVFFGRLSA